MFLSRKIFTDLAVFMIGFGLFMGIIFPFYLLGLGFPHSAVITVPFFASCLTAGLLVGLFNVVLSRMVVARRLRQVSSQMQIVEENLRATPLACSNADTLNSLLLPQEQSEDELGEICHAFNRLLYALQHAQQQQIHVRNYTTVLAHHLDLEGLAQQALEELLQVTAAEGGIIICEVQGSARTLANVGIHNASRLLQSSQLRHMCHFDEVRRLQFPPEVELDGIITHFVPADVFVLPLDLKDRAMGMVLLAKSTSFSRDTSCFVRLIRNSLGLALRNAMSHERLQEIAAVDPLTQLYNRRFGLQRLEEEFSRSRRSSMPLGLIMLDIDHFKSINDTHGHIVGDRILVHVSKLLQQHARQEDIAMRYGGEEFLLLLPGTCTTNLAQMAERLRQEVAQAEFTLEDEKKLRLTISLGVACYPEQEANTGEELIQQADQALYQAKQNGRNQTRCA